MTDHVNPAILAGERVASPGEGDVALACGRILLLGEDNPQSTRPEHALVPWPDNCAGHRLMARIFGIPEQLYLAMRRTNLCCPTWSVAEARARAAAILRNAERDSLIVALGAKVRDAIHHPYRAAGKPPAFFTATQHGPVCGGGFVNVVHLPHPSGRNQIWNDSAQIARARDILREVAPLVPWGSSLS